MFWEIFFFSCVCMMGKFIIVGVGVDFIFIDFEYGNIICNLKS